MAKVLLVDDEESLRMLLGRQLRRADHQVTLAEDGIRALELLEQESFDVVVSDMKMPRLDGMGLLERASALRPDTEFIILTGHGSMENAVEAFKTGRVFDYLLKPLEDIRELDAVVARAVERRHLRSENGRLVCELKQQIDQLEIAREQLVKLAERDGLTGLLNHRTMHERLDAELITSAGQPVSLIMMDMDGFKLVNDTYGHPMGDMLLRHMAGVLEAVCPPGSLIGRCGGDEFMVLLIGKTGSGAKLVAEEIKLYLHSHPFLGANGSSLPVQLCFGISNAFEHDRTSSYLVSAADSALYEGKNQGGDQVTLHMERFGENESDRTMVFDVLESLVTTIDRKDHYTRRHSEDVTQYALHIVDAMGMSEDTTNAVRVAGLLHDIGKIGSPDFILRTPGKLTLEEYEVMKGHVTLSALIIHDLPRLPDILDAVANHHERWDGKGYPKALKGLEIPLLGRVMAVADAFSAMTLDRPYRSGLTVEAALTEIESGSGTQFDPELARLFVDTMRAKYDSVRLAA